jgi:hypothetical protein
MLCVWAIAGVAVGGKTQQMIASHKNVQGDTVHSRLGNASYHETSDGRRNNA